MGLMKFIKKWLKGKEKETLKEVKTIEPNKIVDGLNKAVEEAKRKEKKSTTYHSNRTRANQTQTYAQSPVHRADLAISNMTNMATIAQSDTVYPTTTKDKDKDNDNDNHWHSYLNNHPHNSSRSYDSDSSSSSSSSSSHDSGSSSSYDSGSSSYSGGDY